MADPVRHNVSDPPQRRYHQPGLGGRYAARFAEVSTTAETTWVAWHGYDADTQGDRVYCQVVSSDGQESDPLCLTPQAADHMRPVVSAVDHVHGDVLWVTDQCQLTHAAVRQGQWCPAASIDSTVGWLRDLTVSRHAQWLYCGLIESKGRDDELVIYTNNGDGWRKTATWSDEGFLGRPSLCAVTNDRGWIAYESYRDARYRIILRQWSDGCWSGPQLIEKDEAHCLFPFLTAAVDGTLWLCFVCENVVQRDGVVSRADSIGVARHQDDRWTVEPSGVLLHRGLLPKQRYFGYAGLRRNPRLIPTDDGAVHLVWEQQRSEQEDWSNVWDGRLLAMTHDGRGWADPHLWHDGGSCFAVDHRVIHDSGAIPCVVKADHREAGNDFHLFQVDTRSSPTAPPCTVELSPGWAPYVATGRASRPVTEVNGEPLQLFFGDLHNHSVCSPDAEGHPDELYHFARDVAGIDFAGITDNDFYPDKALMVSESSYQRRLVKRLSEEGTFLAFTGFEWTFHRDDGHDSYNHRSVVYLKHDSPIIRRIDPSGNREALFRRALAPMEVFAHAHHAEYALLGLPQEANVEITSGWAINMDSSQMAHDHLRRGHRFGFIAGSDSHRAVPGLGGALAAVWAQELSREAIAEALRARRCYATNGNRILIDFRVGGVFMGGLKRRETDEPISCTFRVRSANPLRTITIIRNGQPVHALDSTSRELDADWTDPSPPCDPCWYYLRVEDQTPYTHHPHNICQAAGHLAWSSPVWVDSTGRKA